MKNSRVQVLAIRFSDSETLSGKPRTLFKFYQEQMFVSLYHPLKNMKMVYWYHKENFFKEV